MPRWWFPGADTAIAQQDTNTTAMTTEVLNGPVTSTSSAELTITDSQPEGTTFLWQIQGLYGADCSSRLLFYLFNRYHTFALTRFADAINCACNGLCVPPYSNPDPGAYEYNEAVEARVAQDQYDYVRYYLSGYIAATMLIVLLGIAGEIRLILTMFLLTGIYRFDMKKIIFFIIKSHVL